jgi:hypothetical protein
MRSGFNSQVALEPELPTRAREERRGSPRIKRGITVDPVGDRTCCMSSRGTYDLVSILSSSEKPAVSSSDRPTAAFAVSLLAGVLILINGAVLGVVSSFIAPFIGAQAPGPVPGAGQAMMVSGILGVLMVVGVVLGIVVIVAAVMLYRNPPQKTLWGVLVLVLSIVSIFVGGGFLLGLILGVIGGILALIWKPKTT